MYFVICRLDRGLNGQKGRYALCKASDVPFATRRDAEAYAKTINPAREPIVLKAVTAPYDASSSSS